MRDRKFMPIEEAFAAWRKDLEYRKAFAAREDKFTRATRGISSKSKPRRSLTIPRCKA
jgi:hypothetical protein